MEESKLYSQNSEQLFIMDYFSDKPTGKFIDIGAYDAIRFSNVRALFEKGWSGVLVEPAPENYRGIKEHYEGEPRIEVLNVAIGATNDEIDFYDCGGDAISTTDLDHMKKWGDAGVKYTKIKVKQMSVEDFMNEYYFDHEFLNIDTEATNIIVFRNIPDWVLGKVKMICIEHDNYQTEIEERLKSFGFTTRYVNAENIILAK